MAFVNTPNEGVPFYRGVEPKVPVPDNTAAEIISRGTATGVSAFVNMALAAERNKLAQQEMLQRADIAARELEFRRDHMADAHDLTVRGQNVQRDNNNLDYYIQDRNMDMQEELHPHQIKAIDALTDHRAAAATRMMTTNQQKVELVESAQKDAQGLGLLDPNMQAKDPIAYAANAYGFKQMYGASTDKFIKNAVDFYMNKAKESKIGLGAKEYPAFQVVQSVAEQGENSPFWKPLVDAGYVKPETVKTASKTGKWKLQASTVEGEAGQEKSVSYNIAPAFQKMLDSFGKTEFGNIKKIESKVDPASQGLRQTQPVNLGVTPRPTSTSAAGTPSASQAFNATMPDPQANDIDKRRDDATRMIQAHPDLEDQIRAQFAQLTGEPL